MAVTHRATLWCLLALCIVHSWVNGTPLDDYVNEADDTYKWELMAEYPGPGYSQYVLNVTSQTWLTDDVTNQPLWWHYLILVVPEDQYLTYKDTVFFMIDNGNLAEDIPDPATNSRFESTARYAMGMGVVAADLMMIPNQRLHCEGDPPDRWRREDDLIAWTWRRFVDNTTEPYILLRLPMVKGTVRAMDALTEFVPTVMPQATPSNFFVAGGSKRGWTAYLVAAVDSRVIAISPSVINVINFTAIMNHQYEAYGGWSFSNKDYYNEDLMVDINSPEVAEMMTIVDPYYYLDRLTMPKLIIAATGDEHFMPDDPWYFWDDLQGQNNLLWMLEDSGHSTGSSKHRDNIYDNRIAFLRALKSGFTIPTLTWQRVEDGSGGSMTVQTDVTPLNITGVYGDTNTDERRDFRMNIGIPDPSSPVPNPITWYEENKVQQIDANTYRVEYDYPASGWRCFFIKMTFAGPDGSVLYMTTEVNIIPDFLPYPPCQGEECRSILL